MPNLPQINILYNNIKTIISLIMNLNYMTILGEDHNIHNIKYKPKDSLYMESLDGDPDTADLPVIDPTDEDLAHTALKNSYKPASLPSMEMPDLDRSSITDGMSVDNSNAEPRNSVARYLAEASPDENSFIRSESGRNHVDIKSNNITKMAELINNEATTEKAQDSYDTSHDAINTAYSIAKNNINRDRISELTSLGIPSPVENNIPHEGLKDLNSKYYKLNRDNDYKWDSNKSELKNLITRNDVYFRGLSERDMNSSDVGKSDLKRRR